MPDVLVLSPWDAFSVNFNPDPTQRIAVAKLIGDEYVTSVATKSDPAHIAKWSILQSAEVRNISASDIVDRTPTIALPLSGVKWSPRYDPVAAHAITLMDSGRTVRFELRPEDRSSDGDTDNFKHRCELVYKVGGSLSYDTEYWMAYSQMIEEGDPYQAAYCNMGQLHNVADAGEFAAMSPVMADRFDGGSFIFYSRSYFTDPAESNSASTVARHTTSNFPRGVYFNVVKRIKISKTSGAGEYQVWRKLSSDDGPCIELFNLVGIDFGYNDVLGPYAQFGIYAALCDQTIAVRYSDYERWQTASLIDRVSNPVAPPT